VINVNLVDNNFQLWVDEERNDIKEDQCTYVNFQQLHFLFL
jgi:hypothetical protein